MKKQPFLSCLLLAAASFSIFNCIAQTVQVQVDILSGRRTVSPYIYGRNNSLSDNAGSPLSATQWQLYKDAGLNFFRENGGNNLTKYNWRQKLSSHPDWYNNVYAHDWDFAAASLQQHIPAAQGMWGFQLIGQSARNNTNNFDDWDYNGSNWWTGTVQNLAGGGIPNAAGGAQATQNGDTSRYLGHWPADSTTGIIGHWFGPGGQGLDSTKIRYWNMDNEVEIWSSTHDDVMPVQPSAEAFMQLYFAVAKKARALYPGIKLTGPVSPNEWQWYNWNNAPVTGSDGKQYPWMEYFIKRVAEEQASTGIRLLDVIDLHFYPGSSSAAVITQMHRVFFDSSYAFPEANGVKVVNGGWDNSIQVEDIFGRCQSWLNKYMGMNHGVHFAVSETGINSGNDANLLAVWYASTMGEFMKHGVEFFTPWTWGAGMWETLHLYSRYNKGTSVSAVSSDEPDVGSYATVNNTNDSVTVVLVNKSQSQTENVTVQFSGFAPVNQAFTILTLSGLPAGSETFVSHTQNALQTTSISPAGGSLQLSLAPMSVTSMQVAGLQTVLPLSLLNFTGTKAGESVLLHFTLTDDKELSRIEIERSAGGADFSRIGTIAGPASTGTAAAGNGSPAMGGSVISGSTINDLYSFSDDQPLPAIGYYRLRMIDVQGKGTYSPTLAIRMGGSEQFTVFPNPAKNVLHVQWSLPAGIATPRTTAAAMLSLRIVDAAGKTVKSLSIPGTGTVSTQVDISSLQKGLYYIFAGEEVRSFLKQ
ncbi:MAG TPA: glycoside hydrolase family 44 protein [Puia sp.]|nr:glycoside hydrolase family 44 protein [Puia sp.]